MKVLYNECIKALRDNKCSECNDFYQCSVCDYLQEQYKKGRTDKYQEIVSNYMLLTENQVSEIRADMVKEFEHLLYLYGYYEPYSKILKIYHEDLIRLIQQLKEGNK